MEVWTQGYVADIDYTHGFYRELTPSLLAFAMLLKGFRPPELGRPFAYLELGFGQGFSTNLLAAANPEGSFWGTDFNPSHAAFASRLAADADTPNVRFLDHSFEGFLAEDTPTFDIVGLHGVYSWISRENRQAIVRIIRDKLGFGGVVYNSYNCLPGWSPAMPLRQLLITHGAGSAEPTIARLDKALAFAARLAELGAAYFAHNPGVGRRLEGMREASRNYLAHEYLNRDWNPQYHAEVAAEMSEAKLSFAASAHLADHLDALNLSAEARQLLAEIGDPVFRETVRDYFVNQQFRRDIYVKGALRLSAPEQRELLAATRFALLTPRDEVPMKAAFALGEASFQEEVYGPVLDGLAPGPAMLGELLARPAIAPIGLPRVLEALTVLTAGGHAAPGLPEDGQDERRTRTDAFNAAVLERARFHGELQALASPVTGGGVPLGRFEQLFLLARKKGDADPGGFAWSVLEAQGQRIVKDGRALESAEDNRAELRARAEAFHARRLEVLQSLGVT